MNINNLLMMQDNKRRRDDEPRIFPLLLNIISHIILLILRLLSLHL